jgi:hypothetical protein
MKWAHICQQHPHQWLLIEAITAHSEANQRILDDIAVVDVFPDSVTAFQRYQSLHREAPHRELYVLLDDQVFSA